MQTPESVSIELRLKNVEAVIRNAVRQKLRVTLRANDYREQNLDALDLLQDIRLKLIQRLSNEDSAGEAPSIQEFSAYAATVTYHTCWDYLRAKYPKRTSLKNCLRRILDKTNEYDVWQGESGELICGFTGWRNPSFQMDSARIAELRMDPSRLPGECLGSGSAMGGAEWRRLLDGIFRYVDGPMALDDLIAIVAPVVGMQDVPDASQGEDSEEGGEEDLLVSPGPTPYSAWLTCERLKLFWGAVLKLLVWHRVAYLLNFREGDLDSLPYYGVATVEQIGDALELTGKQFSVLARELGIVETPEKRLTAGARFVFFWKYLPLEDNLIATLLEVTRPQVISYRSKAKDRLKRMLKGEL